MYTLRSTSPNYAPDRELFTNQSHCTIMTTRLSVIRCDNSGSSLAASGKWQLPIPNSRSPTPDWDLFVDRELDPVAVGLEWGELLGCVHICLFYHIEFCNCCWWSSVGFINQTTKGTTQTKSSKEILSIRKSKLKNNNGYAGSVGKALSIHAGDYVYWNRFNVKY